MFLKGHKHSQETKKRMSETRKGKYPSEEHRKKLSESRKGIIPWNKGISTPGETKKKISETKKGNKNHFWKGGISFLPYSPDWTKSLKHAIRVRDNFTCQLCLKSQNGFSHHIHHIDYNKLNSNPKNLITLCISCHVKTNCKNTKYWKNLFTKAMKRREENQLKLQMN